MNIYFSGIGGVAIGPLAEIAYDAGYEIAGSDPEESLVTSKLIARGITISKNQDGSFLRSQHNKKPIDWFVYTSSLPADHPELMLAKSLDIRISKRDELLNFIINDKKLSLIAIAGTHGKTTTTGMMIWALQQLNVPVSYSLGTTIGFGPSGRFDPNSKYFIYECDEFDKNFLNFKPFLSVITSIDYDHPETYPTQADYLSAFKSFGQNSKAIITWKDQHSELFSNHSNVEILNNDQVNSNLSLAGNHNRRNATLVQRALTKLGLNQDSDKILNSFPGTNRRFEKLADNLYSDYGHHPAEIAATMQMASEISNDIVLVYQPHQNVRQHEIKDQYTNQFELAKDVYWLPTYLSREDKNLPILTFDDLTKNITNKNHVYAADLNDDLWDKIQKAREEGVLVLAMGAGSIDSWVRKQLNKAI